jgi:predicted alpha/beta-fold hydrolase
MAPVFGFADKFDYYRKSGSIYYLNQIRIPSIVINARDDPFIEETSLPSNNDIGPNTPLRIIYHDYGGHCGFKAHDPPSENGWLAEEMGRVLHHIDEEHLRLIDTKEFNNYESSIKV